jgi:hypothetical protein
MRRCIRISFTGGLLALVLISGCSGQAKKEPLALENGATLHGAAKGRIRPEGQSSFQSARVSIEPAAGFESPGLRTVWANFLAENQTDSDSAISEEESLATADLAEIDRRLNNPLTSLLSLTFQDNLNVNKGDAVDGRAL